MCKERNISFPSHDESIDPSKHLNVSKLHFNSNGIKIFAESFSRFLVKLNWHQQRKTILNTSIFLDLDKKSHSRETPNKGSTEFVQTGNPKEILKNLRLKNVNRLICAQLNINSIKNKFDSLVNVIKNNTDVLMISETKLDLFFPIGQFHIHNFSELFRFDQNGNGGGTLLYIYDDIPSKLIITKMTIEWFFVKINLRKKKWVLCCSYNPKKPLTSEHLNRIGKNLDLLLSKYDNFMLIGDLNAEPTEAAVSDFCEIYNLKHLIKDEMCFKNPTKRTCIDLIVTNRPKWFQDTVVFERRLSDFHKMGATVMKMYYTRQKPSIVHYRIQKLL